MNSRRLILKITILIFLTAACSHTLLAQTLFWEDTIILVKSKARFPKAAVGGGLIAVVWQEFVTSNSSGGEIYLSIRSSRDAVEWQETKRFAGPFPFQDHEAPIYSLAVDSRGRIYIALTAEENITTILCSDDSGITFRSFSSIRSVAAAVAPALSITDSGNLILFVTQQTEDFLSIHYAVSTDGIQWSRFQPLVSDTDLPINFLPAHTSFNGREYVIFQTLKPEAHWAYQLRIKISRDGGYTWDKGTELSFEEKHEGEIADKELFNNQRPFITPLNGKIALAWERKFQNDPPQIYYAELDGTGKIIGESVKVTEGVYVSHFPQMIAHKNIIHLFWFDNRRGDDHIFVAAKQGFRWIEKDISKIPGSSTFACPVILQDNLYVFWENRVGHDSNLVFLEPDQTVAAPAVSPINFDPARESKQDTVRVRWTVPRDSSGIDGFNFTWSQNPDKPVPQSIAVLSDTTSTSLTADREGTWYFRISALDYAGNWSKPASISFIQDKTPPEIPEMVPPELDPDGFLIANTFSLSWLAPDNEDTAGYSYSLRFAGMDEPVQESSDVSLPERSLTREPGVSFINRDNGFWVFSVAAIDRAGNMSKPESLTFKLNKYIPVTYISNVDARKDLFGNVNLKIMGRGFTESGLIEKIILDRDGIEPYDYIFDRSLGLFRVPTDRVIDHFSLVDLEEGQYRVGVIHPVRGLHFTTSVLSIESRGTIKFGNFNFRYTSPWEKTRFVSYFFSINNFIIWLVVLFLFILLVVSVKKLGSLLQDGRIIKGEMMALIQGDRSVIRKEEKMEELKRRGMGLRLKFTSLIMILVLIIVLMVSIPLGNFMINAQRRNLAQGLHQRVDVLLGSLSSGAGTYLPLQNRIELGLLPEQVSSFEEIRFVSIAGPGANDPNRFDYVWAEDDADIDSKIIEGKYVQGETRIEDAITPLLKPLEEEINVQANKRVSALAAEADRLSDEMKNYIGKTDAESIKKGVEAQEASRAVNKQIQDELQEFKSITGSFPDFEFQNLFPFYTFYRPIIYREKGESIYYRGVVRLGVSTEKIIAEIVDARNNLIIRTGIIAFIAAGLGLLGAIIMASITINPIKKLAAGVAVIRDTEDKEKLKTHHIDVKSKDEIGTLASTVNQMTQALVKAAIASKDLTVGKEVQKMFIPLEKDASGRKGTTGGEVTDQIEIYGYYEGAKGVSGDYFDYIKLADKYYAVIKCDVAGKGVPAALIMVEVATIFSTFFRNWTPKDPGLKIDSLAYMINDMLEERGFKGRFAALTLCIINAESGKSYYCNAGDVNLHIYRKDQQKMTEIKLPEAPAAGVFPSNLVEMQSGFKQVSHPLNSGDAVFLFTDGVEEAKRLFRNNKFETIKCDEPGLEENEEHGGTHLKGSDNEELGIPRIYDIINALYNKQKYRLTKFHNPIPDEELIFDFSSCSGTVEEAVLAMVSVEKIFRIYTDPSSTRDDKVTVDKKIVEFLRGHFEQFDSYLKHPLEADEESDTITFTHLKEDEQYDDLTILAIGKK